MTESPVLRLPPGFLASLSDRCRRAGPAATSALREAGRELGERLVRELPARHDPAEASPEAFWDAAAGLLADRGLGELAIEIRTPSLAELRLASGPEAIGDADGGEGDAGRGDEELVRGSRPFTTGLLGGVLTAAADAPVAVLEVSSPGDGDDRWLAGRQPALEEVRGSLEDGASVREALEAL